MAKMKKCRTTIGRFRRCGGGYAGLGSSYCVSTTTGKRVSCKRQRAGRKAARSRKR